MTKWPVQKLAQGTTQKLLQHHDATTTKTGVATAIKSNLRLHYVDRLGLVVIST